ncbi:heptose-I-phosphate ethanolaminephosphotransferase [Atopomonas hussainii]|uniref:Heptose-I-phosphate ethanolaminephosphotransferase n=1 Tax=Atopomonas hussainii TaxID=1429083 RepID=A0A1H7NBY3_9GAMM|nr:phosphoethanolamine transferase CptA [Atopomonas hussainii]SEL21010.1 heptose-I-phosphate ethanolaminephosphotransferase [Atopomonas hussainii]
MQHTVQSTSTPRFDWRALGWQFLFFWYFSGVTHLLIQLNGDAGFSGFRQATTMSILWLTPTLLWPAQTKRITAVLGLLLGSLSLLSFGYYLVYGQEFSQSVIFILFESNLREGSEYLVQYLSLGNAAAFAAYIAGAWLIWRYKIRPAYAPQHWRPMIAVLVLISSVGYPFGKEFLATGDLHSARVHLEKRLEPAVPWQLLMGYAQYREQLHNMQNLLAQNQALPPLEGLKDLSGNGPQTVVLVIGESTNRQRMSLYGYRRDTSPELQKRRAQLAVFDNVVTPRPYTIEALQQVLTFADQTHPNDYLTTPSVVNLMKQAGYKTYWVTNQQTITARNTMLTTFSQQADEQVYLNNNREQNARQYDDDVLKPFAKALNDPAPRKFIVVHLLGTHMSYQYRYPQNYERFTDRQGAPAWVDDYELPTYNSYDNAVLFNDHVVAGLIERLDSGSNKGLLVYLSDHGEAVFDAPDDATLGRNEGRPTAPMYTVPFIVWRSAAWQSAHPRDFSSMLQRPYSSMNFIHTLADLSELRFDRFEPSKSLVNAGFVAQPLLIGNPEQPKNLIDFSLIKPKTAPTHVAQSK